MGATTVYGVFHLLFTIFQCGSPRNFGLADYDTNPACVGWPTVLGINLAAGLINAIADWIFAILPIFVLRKSNIPRSAKITVVCIILFGAIGSLSSVVRLAYIQGYRPSNEFLYKSIPFGTCSVVECGVGITAGCLATLRPLFHRVKQGAQGTLTPNASHVRHRNSELQSLQSCTDGSVPLSRLSQDARGKHQSSADAEKLVENADVERLI